MTLADFARSLGVPPGTARVWKKRGWITEDGGHFWLVCRQCGQSYCGYSGACHVYCSEECAGGREDNCAACKRGPLKPCGCRGAETCENCRAPSSGLEFYGTNLDLSSWPKGQVYVRSSSGTSPERIAELRKQFAEQKAKAATCAGCADLAVSVGAAQADIASLVAENTELRDRIAGLETDIRFLRTRIGEPGPAPVAITLSAADQAAAMIEAHRRG